MHKGSTYTIGKILVEKIATENDTVSQLFLPRDMPNFCVGCTKCILQDEQLCPHNEYTLPAAKLMNEADLLIFTTPVYVFHTTGQMKTFLDHFAYRWMVHRPEKSMFNKQAVVISTAAGAGMRPTNKDVTDSLYFWGVGRVYKYGIAVQATGWKGVSDKKKEKISHSMDKLCSKIKKRENNVTACLKTKILFKVMRIFQKKIGISPLDKIYWQNNGWLDKKRPWKH